MAMRNPECMVYLFSSIFVNIWWALRNTMGMGFRLNLKWDFPTICPTLTSSPPRLLMPCVPVIHVAAKWTHAFNQDWVLVQSSLQKMSGQGVRTHPPMVLLAMAREIKLLAFFKDSEFTFFLVWRPFYIVSKALPPSLMVGRLFGSSWCF